MSANSSFSSCSNLSLHPLPPNSSLNSSFPIYKCFERTDAPHVLTALTCSYILFYIPLCVFILHLGHKRWRGRRSASAVMTSSSDLFTYNIVVMEMIGVLGYCFFCYGCYAKTTQMKIVGIYVHSLVTPGQMFFHILTSVERYLAVTYPIFYLRLKASGVRNISILCAWLISFGCLGFTTPHSLTFPTVPFVILLVFSVIVNSFCSLSVLRILNRPGPGEGGGDRHMVDQLKRKAFHTIIAINGALLLKFGGLLLCLSLHVSAVVSYRNRCLLLVSGLWFGLPSSYVLPLLFLHRARKLPCFQNNTEPGQGSE